MGFFLGCGGSFSGLGERFLSVALFLFLFRAVPEKGAAGSQFLHIRTIVTGDFIDGEIGLFFENGAIGGRDSEVDFHLVDGLEAGDFEEDGLPVRVQAHPFDFDDVFAFLPFVFEGELFGSIVGRPEVVPLEETVSFIASGGLGIEFEVELEADSVWSHFDIGKQFLRGAGVADAVDTALGEAWATAAVPPVEADSVDLSIGGICFGAVDAGDGIEFEFYDRGLGNAFHVLEHHVVKPAFAEAGVEEASGERAPAGVVDPELATGRVIELLRHPDEGLVEGIRGDDLGVVDGAAVGGPLFSCFVLNVSVESAGVTEGDFRGGHPVALVVAYRGTAVGEDAHAVWCAESGAIDFAFGAIG